MNNTVDVVDTIDVSEYSANRCNGTNTGANAYDKTLCQDNKDLTSFINKCLLLDQTFEMEQIMQKVLLPAYVCADDEYKKSEKFNRVIKKATQRLIDEPMKKYSHISDVTDTLKFHIKRRPKKRVNFITLSTTSVLGKSNGDKRKRVMVNNESNKSPNKPKLDVIAVDSEEDDNDLMAVDDTANQVEDDDDLIAVDVRTKLTEVGDGFIAVNLKTKKTDVGDDDLIAVDVERKKMEVDNDDLIVVDDKAKEKEVDDKAKEKKVDDKPKKTKVNNDFPAVHVKTKKVKIDDDLPVVDVKTKKIKIDYSLKKPKLGNNKLGIKTDFKERLKLKKSKDKHATTVKPDAVCFNNTTVNHKKSTKLKEAIEVPSYVTLDVENNNNTPIEIQDSQELKIIEATQIDNNKINTKDIYDRPKVDDFEEIQCDKENLESNENLSDPSNKLLVPRMEIVQVEEKELPKESNNTENDKRIKVIEVEIAKAKKKIADLEVAEVTEDSSVSAYIRCDRLQAHIVKLYKELCSLVDAEPVKGRQVRLLRLAEGQPEGPLKRLERFLNKQVDEDGVAPFPDFADVVRCVEKSNVKDGLGWSKGKIHREAQALFEYCGRALQKRRQRREWKHLRAQVPREAFDADPAATDPELSAKLELNRQLALRQEADILEKFTRMETMSETLGARVEDSTQETNETDSSSRIEDSPKAETGEPMNQEIEEIQNNKETQNGLIIRIKEEPYEVPVENYFTGDNSIVIEISDSESSDDDESLCLTQDF